MGEPHDEAYLAGLPEEQRAMLAKANKPGLARLSELMASGEAIAFLGAGASAPLYPLWTGVIDELVQAADRLTDAEAATCRALASASPDAVVEIVRRRLGPAAFWECLSDVFRVRRDSATGRTWTPTHELIARCNFGGVVTTNYDPGILDARIKVRPAACSTAFASWTDELPLDRWRSGAVFEGVDELPVLFAHGHHNQPNAIVLGTASYRRAYAGKLGKVLGALTIGGRFVWVGFSFADQRIISILREIGDELGTSAEPGGAARHVAVMPWDPTDPAPDPGVLRDICELQYGSQLVLYPADGSDHSALGLLLESFTDPRFAPAVLIAPAVAAPATESPAGVVRWEHGGDPVEHFSGRVEELAKLDRWAADASVRLVSVTAWGGAGKTALVTEWLVRHRGAERRQVLRGIFGWSFYENSSEEAWAEALLDWAKAAFGIAGSQPRLGDRVLDLAQRVPLVLVLDGLELLQEGPEGSGYGRLLGGLLRDVLTGLCRLGHCGLAIVTSRFPFADLERFDGSEARMLEVPALSTAEGAELLARGGAGWLGEGQRSALVAAVDGHALAVGALAGALGERPPTGDVQALLADLAQSARTSERVRHVLAFYAERLGARDRMLVGIVSLFQRPVTPSVVLALGQSSDLGSALAGWTEGDVGAAARQRLGGVLTSHADGTLSAHPLVRDSFRPLAMNPGSVQLASQLALDGLPAGAVGSRQEALRVLEIVELLLEADQWSAADELFRARTDKGDAFTWLPAAALGQRCALAFVGTPARQAMCAQELRARQLGFYLATVGLRAANAGDISIAQQYLEAGVDHERASGDRLNLAINLENRAHLLTSLGRPDLACADFALALDIYQDLGDVPNTRDGHAGLGLACAASGETTRAEHHFLEADRLEHRIDRAGEHLYSLRGASWADLLLRTNRAGPARRLTAANHRISTKHGWNESIARCERLLGRLDLAEGQLVAAGEHFEAAVATFRDGDYLLELAATLVHLGEQQRRAADHDPAERSCNEAIEIAAPRDLVPTHAAALAARARIRADRSGDSDLANARDDADHALRLASRLRQLPWQQLDALEAHAHIDRAEGADHGWAAQAQALRAILVPEGLDPDPLATVEAEAEAKAAADAAEPG